MPPEHARRRVAADRVRVLQFAPMWLLFLSLARAGFPEDVSLLAMQDWDGASTQSTTSDDYVAAGYHQLVQELGLAIANRPLTPAETLGINGFAMSFGSSAAFIRTGSLDGVHPSGWDLADPDEDPQVVLAMPWVSMQKGLPGSLELDANFGWIAETTTGFFGVDGRWAPVEGYRQFPDIALRLGYSGYVGNDELEVGVVDMGATLGYTVPFGVTKGIHQAKFSPYVGFNAHRIHAAPRVDLSDAGLDTSITEVSGAKSSDYYDKAYAPVQVNGGFRLQNGTWQATLAAAYTPKILPTVHLGLGFVY